MNPPSTLPHRTVAVAALAVGVWGNILVRGEQGPGLSMPLFLAGLAAAVVVVLRVRGRSPSPEGLGWIAGGVTLSLVFVLRGSPPLQFMAFVAAAACFAFAALRGGASWARASGVGDYAEAVAGSMGFAGLGGFGVAARFLGSGSAGASRLSEREEGSVPSSGSDEQSGSGSSFRLVPAVLRGLVLAAPVLFVFGVLFVSADPVFEGMVSGLAGTLIEDWGEHLAVTAFLAWLAAGWLTGFLRGTRVRGVVTDALGDRARKPSIGIVEAGVVLGLLALLFAVFVIVQFRYLFGGAELVEVTPGLTYAEYAREGFGLLAVAAALVLPTLLVLDWLLDAGSTRALRVFRSLGGLQLALLAPVVASAFVRVNAYQEAYGWTESRFYGAIFLGWLVLLAVGLAATVLTGRRERFATPAVTSGLALVILLAAVNPDARIATANLSRAGGGDTPRDTRETGDTPEPAVSNNPSTASSAGAGRPPDSGSRPPTDPDVLYLASLSADAVPALLNGLPGLEAEARCALARRLLERWGPEQPLDWQSWNRAVVRARRAVATERPTLQAAVDSASCPER